MSTILSLILYIFLFTIVLKSLEQIWNLFRTLTPKNADKDVGDLRKEVDDLKHQVQILQFDLLKVRGQLDRIKDLHESGNNFIE